MRVAGELLARNGSEVLVKGEEENFSHNTHYARALKKLSFLLSKMLHFLSQIACLPPCVYESHLSLHTCVAIWPYERGFCFTEITMTMLQKLVYNGVRVVLPLFCCNLNRRICEGGETENPNFPENPNICANFSRLLQNWKEFKWSVSHKFELLNRHLCLRRLGTCWRGQQQACSDATYTSLKCPNWSVIQNPSSLDVCVNHPNGVWCLALLLEL